MSNFDDIFNQPAAQPETEATMQEKPQRKREWWQIKEEKQRREAYATLDRIFTEFSEGKGDVQGISTLTGVLTAIPPGTPC